MQAKTETESKQAKPTFSGLIKTKQDLHILAEMIFATATKKVFINTVQAEFNTDCVCLLERIKNGCENIISFKKTSDTLHITTEN